MTTKLGRMMTYLGLLPIKSHGTEKERAEKENMQETPKTFVTPVFERSGKD